MAALATIFGLSMILLIAWEGFETIIMPRRVIRRFRLTAFFYRRTWLVWVKLVDAVVPARLRETWLSLFGPMSLLLLLSIWASVLILGFALLQNAADPSISTQGGSPDFLSDLYLSGTTFFTLGLGDVVPHDRMSRFLVVVESGMGFAFLALVISYLPSLNQSFSRREVSISLLDARAGSPPTASEMLSRHGREHDLESLRQLLGEWEHWSAEFLEGHLSYPVLAYFRSQHDNQSWLAALAAVLDTCALVTAGVQGACRRQARLTFAMARHAVVDLCLIFRVRPIDPPLDRLPPETLAQLRATLAEAGIPLEAQGDRTLSALRRGYEPYLHGLSAYFHIPVPPWVAAPGWIDNWQARTSGAEAVKNEHF